MILLQGTAAAPCAAHCAAVCASGINVLNPEYIIVSIPTINRQEPFYAMLAPVHRRVHLTTWPLVAFCLIIILVLLSPIGRRALLPSSPEEHSQISSSTLLEDVSNATLGVSGFNKVLARRILIGSQFQKIFVIGLASRTDRRDSMSLAAALTGLQIEYVNGVTSIDKSVLPPGDVGTITDVGTFYAWRAHMNVMRL